MKDYTMFNYVHIFKVTYDITLTINLSISIMYFIELCIYRIMHFIELCIIYVKYYVSYLKKKNV